MNLPMLGVAAGFQLLPHVAAYWKLDEATAAVRASTVGSENLADNNSVAQVAGKLGSAAQFTAASSMSLSRASDSVLANGSGDFFLAGWYNPTTTGDQPLVTKGTANGLTYDYELSLVSTKMYFGVKDSAASISNVSANTFGAVTAGTFLFFLAYYDSVNRQIGISVNGGAFDVTAMSNAVLGNSAANFRMGAYSDAVGGFANGILDSIVLGKPTVPVATIKNAIRDLLYGGGGGKEYPWK